MQKKDKRGLTRRQEAYCKERMKGKTQADSYKDAGYSTRATDKTISEAACRLEKIEVVKKRLEELQAQVDAGALATLDQIAADLLQIASDSTRPDSIRLKAYDQLAKLQGGYTDNYKISATGSLSLEDKKAAIQSLLG